MSETTQKFDFKDWWKNIISESELKAIKHHEINKKNLFIDGYYIDPRVCDNLISYFKSSDKKYVGKLGVGKVMKDKKDSTDLQITPPEFDTVLPIMDYCGQLKKVLVPWLLKYPQPAHNFGPWSLLTPFNIQHYKPGGGYFIEHCERDGYSHTFRVLAFMTYLNDVTDGGETYWPNQDVKIKPEKGLTAFWPTDYTHTHQGIVSKTQDKYITTGWYSFDKENVARSIELEERDIPVK